MNEPAVIEKTTPRKRRAKGGTIEQEKYFEKYAKIVGENSGLDAAKLTVSNKSYGMGEFNNSTSYFVYHLKKLFLRERILLKKKL